MKVIVPGHRYELANFELPGIDDQELKFIHKEPATDSTGWKLETISDGTTNEEVLAVLIDRMQFLQKNFPCRENALVITKLQEALMWLKERTRDREARGVEGKHKK